MQFHQAFSFFVDVLGIFFDPSIFKSSVIYQNYYAMFALISLAYIFAIVILIVENYVISDQVGYQDENKLRGIVYGVTFVIIALLMYKLFEIILIISIVLSVAIKIISGILIVSFILERKILSIVPIVLAVVAYLVLNVVVAASSAVVAIALKLSVSLFVVVGILVQLDEMKIINLGDIFEGRYALEVVLTLVVLLLPTLIKVDAIGSNVGSTAIGAILKVLVLYVVPYAYMFGIGIGLIFVRDELYDAMDYVFISGIVLIILVNGGLTINSSVQAARSGQIQVIINKDFDETEGRIRTYNGTIVVLENRRYPCYLKTSMEYIPLDFENYQNFIGKKVRLTVEFEGIGRNFTIIKIEERGSN